MPYSLNKQKYCFRPYAFLLLLIGIYTSTCQHVTAQTNRIITFNIKYDNQNDTINNWDFRKEKMAQLLKHYHPHFIGTQEGLYNQIMYLDSALTDYKYIGVGREDGKQKGEYAALFYNAKIYTVLQSGTFWLSETPNKVSKGWDAALERICTYGLFKDSKFNEKFWVLNTHFDHIGVQAREHSAKLILTKIKEINTQGLPVILMGDFNLTPDKNPIATIKKYLKDSKEIAQEPPYGPVGTFNGFTEKIMKDRIDYIFVKGFKVLSYVQIDDRLDNNKHVSDHLPVMVDLIEK